EAHALRESSGCVTFLYCGNLGRMHDVDALVNGMSRIISEGIYKKGRFRFEFRANGYGYSKLKERLDAFHASGAVFFGGPISDNTEWANLMLTGDVALVSLADGAENLLMPSKVYSAMVAGQAVLAVCSDRSDLASLIKVHDLGWV